ncbi:DUF4339 domain-containing protein [Biostraticola tofi]|uniref:Uncharacterized protein DUF4339 n=1 Tax=Biostraticola tofi TaxID=466109 RepID=A0A4R3YYN1_9GAMM|nr:DUF4339 domain-containing protein [Biostraticola tofi]TCV96614.1 uncharacterized protein DUF4339 [Biostraticola tofi]
MGNTRSWWFVEHSEKRGPLPEDAFVDCIKNGRINQQTLVWSDGRADWEMLGGIPQFKPVIGRVPPPVPRTLSLAATISQHAELPATPPLAGTAARVMARLLDTVVGGILVMLIFLRIKGVEGRRRVINWLLLPVVMLAALALSTISGAITGHFYSPPLQRAPLPIQDQGSTLPQTWTNPLTGQSLRLAQRWIIRNETLPGSVGYSFQDKQTDMSFSLTLNTAENASLDAQVKAFINDSGVKLSTPGYRMIRDPLRFWNGAGTFPGNPRQYLFHFIASGQGVASMIIYTHQASDSERRYLDTIVRQIEETF